MRHRKSTRILGFESMESRICFDGAVGGAVVESVLVSREAGEGLFARQEWATTPFLFSQIDLNQADASGADVEMINDSGKGSASFEFSISTSPLLKSSEDLTPIVESPSCVGRRL